jgi:type VI secretion system protein ImpC
MLAVISMSNTSRSSVVLEAEPDISPARQIDSDTPFRILVLGDFSGRANRGVHADLAGRRPTLVDLDNFEGVMEAMQPALLLKEHVPHVALRFRELDDFHPDHIYRTAEIFQRLADLEYQSPRVGSPPAPVPAGAGLLDSILEQADDAPVPAVEEAGDLAAFIKKAMAPHLEARPDAGKVQWEARKEAALGEQMRAILHHSDFQTLEAAWRAVWMLVQRLGDDVKIYLLDATLGELLADPSALEKLLTGPRDPWSLLVGNFVFGESERDARRLEALGLLANAAGAPFIAEGEPPSAEVPPDYWRQLRQSPIARWIGLALPRFLLRVPYGKATSPVEAFAFEEMKGSVHAEYLWGNPAFCCAYLLGLGPGKHRQIDELPLHTYRSGGESVNQPCAEMLLSEKDAEFLMECGYMPLASLKDQNAALLVRFQSIADPLAPLSGIA